MKTNIPQEIDAELLREARIPAAKLEQTVQQRKGFHQAHIRAKARLSTGYDLGWTPPTSRDEIYER
jgi:hypothetical protein